MKTSVVLGVLTLAAAGSLFGQQPQPAVPLAVGTEAPDFTLPSATRVGVGKAVSLHDFRGQVVVLAFFFRARTPG